MGITRICINSIGEENWFSFRVALAWLYNYLFSPFGSLEFCTLKNGNKRKWLRRTWSLELWFENTKICI